MDERAVTAEAARQFRKSIGTKLLLFILAWGSMWSLVQLDEIRAELKRTKEQPYRDLARAKGALVGAFYLETAVDRLQIAANNGTASRQFDSPDALFNALYSQTKLPDFFAAQRHEIFDKYARAIRERNEIIEELGTSPLTRERSEQLDREIAQRNALIENRGLALAEIERNSTRVRDAFRQQFDTRAVAKKARHEFKFFKDEELNGYGQLFGDAEHPASVIFDILWYASLVVGVVSIVALILAPLFGAMPVSGTEERFWDSIKSLLGRAPGAVRGVGGAAALTIGVVAVATAAGNVPSSPWPEANFPGRRAYQQPPIIEPPPIEITTHAGEFDLRIAQLVEDVNQLFATDKEHGRTLDDHTSQLRPLTGLPTRLDGVEIQVADCLLEQADQERRLLTAIERSHTNATLRAASYTDRRVEAATSTFQTALRVTNGRVDAVETTVSTAEEAIGEHATIISNGVFQPYLIGERPPAWKAALGLDRYRATEATELILKQNKADEKIVKAIEGLKNSNKTYSQDELLRTLRAWACGDHRTRCAEYLKWSPLILRTARL